MTLKCHLLIADLFLPQEAAAAAGAGLPVPVLEKLLARAQRRPLAMDNLEDWLCTVFGIQNQAIAPITLQADGMPPGEGYWLRADPAHVQMQREQMILRPGMQISSEEAAQLCASLNTHFADEGLHFVAPHPQRWYLHLAAAPNIMTRPLPQVAGRNIRAHLPQGPDTLRWNGIFNEIQMLFFEHAVNQAREARGELPVNSVWLWGGGYAPEQLLRPFSAVYGDSPLAAAFAQAAGIPYTVDNFTVAGNEGVVLVVWEDMRRALQRGDLHAWRDAVQRLEQNVIVPLWRALAEGKMAQLTVDIMNAGMACRLELTRSDRWKLWRWTKSLTHYTLV